MRGLRLAPAVLALFALACSSSSSPSAPSDPTSEAQAFSYLTNLLPVEVSEGGASGNGYVDTGNPFVLLDPGRYSSVGELPPDGGDVASIEIDAQTASNVYVIPTTAGLTSPDPSVPIFASVGCSAICSFVATFNYRDVEFGVGPSAPAAPDGLMAETVVPFTLEGGSVIDGVTIPRSRVVVPVVIEGKTYTMIVDSGATMVTVSAAVFSTLTIDGRPTLDGGTAETTAGTSSTTLARAKSVAVGGALVDSVAVAHDSSFDTNLATISMDVGHTIDGSLGGTFLNNFYVTIDYPAQTLHLAPYASTDFIADPAHEIGLGLAPSGRQYVVNAAVGDAASKGIGAGDVVTSIDGQEITGLGPAQTSLLLFGAVGSTKMVSFGSGALAGQTIGVTVQEFLQP